MSKNVFGENLEICSSDPLTGFFRTGNCDTNIEDIGMHSVCIQITDEFLQFSIEAGNDLSTPNPFYNFKGLKQGDKWCLCLSRWIEAYNAGCAPKIYLKSTHISALEFIEMEILQQFAADSDIA